MVDRSLLVLEPGLLTTVQDLGRPGLARSGVSPGGVLDRAALILGNRLLGNDPGEAALEATLLGPRLRFRGSTVVALTGAALGASLNGARLPRWQPVRIAAGDELAFQPLSDADARGVRAYLCIAGGLVLAPVMGSRSTDLFGGFGGWHGRALRAGDALSLGAPGLPVDQILARRLAASPPEPGPSVKTRVVLGPQAERFTEEGVAAFLGSGYTVSPQADRMGMRLTGPPVTHSRGADLISEGIAHGAVQVPGDGQPIVLLAARQTVGGYPKIATVIGADLDPLGQLRPGDSVHFAAVEPAEARALTLASRAALGEDAVVTTPRAHAGWTPPGDPTGRGEGGDGVTNAWDPAGVTRLIVALREADVTAFRLEVAAEGLDLKLELRRGADDGFLAESEEGVAVASAADETPAPVSPGSSTPEQSADLVTAPLLGVFYRRSAPDQPPLAEVGQRVEAGQPIGVLEVMKTYHEVTTPRAGIVAAFLVDDAQFVEYGQPIARLEPAHSSHDTG